jgi:hypothetical protein
MCVCVCASTFDFNKSIDKKQNLVDLSDFCKYLLKQKRKIKTKQSHVIWANVNIIMHSFLFFDHIILYLSLSLSKSIFHFCLVSYKTVRCLKCGLGFATNQIQIIRGCGAHCSYMRSPIFFFHFYWIFIFQFILQNSTIRHAYLIHVVVVVF